MAHDVRVRAAPSPTGNLHIGNARAFLFNWLFARHHVGEFILRIEDTDLERSEKKYEEDIIENLEWLGLKWDEFYRQSDRTKIYSKYIQKLLDGGKAFWCYHSQEELEKERLEQTEAKSVPRHVCDYKKREVASGEKEKGIIRLAIDSDSTRKIKFNDIIRGEIEFEERLLGDIGIAKDQSTPLYHLAVVIDDYEMDITHVVRGEDHIANTPKQILIQEALGFDRPQYAHLPLILGSDRSKLSKRHGATAVSDYRKLGYLPDALVNFMALLGWHPEDTEQEVLTKNEIIEKFSLETIHKAGAVFDIKKLNWLNSQYIKMENDAGLAKLVEPFVEKHFGKQDKDLLIKIAPLLRERLEYLDQVQEFHFFFKEPDYENKLLRWEAGRQNEEIKKSLEAVASLLKKLDWEHLEKGELRKKLDELSKDEKAKYEFVKFSGRAAVYWPLRVALSGETKSPDPVDIAYILGKQKTLERVERAVHKFD